MENNENQIEIQVNDIVNATKIMEYAISKNIFSIKELSEVAPIVARFQEFVAAVTASQQAEVQEEKTEAVQEVQDKDGE